MAEGVIIHIDSDPTVLKQSKDLFDQVVTNIDYVTVDNKDDFKLKIGEFIEKGELKGLIFDLVGKSASSKELLDGNAEFLSEIEDKFASINLPIFIYSGSIHLIEDRFNNCGTIYKVDKDQDFKESIIDKFKLLLDSGFIQVFQPGGILERELHQDLNQAFIRQFSDGDQIEKIILAINEAVKNDQEKVDRVQKVFKRVAIRSLLSALLEPEELGEGKLKPEFVNPIEHYLQRINSFDFWTGDVFQKSDNSELLLILTPRCNVASKSVSELLVCKIFPKTFPSDTSNREKKDKIGYALTDKPEISGYDRYLPPSPIFIGGKVALSEYRMISKDELINEYNRIITLSDELTNEILGKFGAYFFRTGINPWDKSEAIAQIEIDQKSANGEK